MSRTLKSIERSQLSNLKMVAGNENKYNIIIDGKYIKEWVGIGWITIGEAERGDEKKYHTVIN